MVHGPGYMGLAADMWVPMGARVPMRPPNDDPSPSQSRSTATDQPTDSNFMAFKGPIAPAKWA